MDEREVLVRIQAMQTHHHAVMLARFWLNMESISTSLPFTFQDLRSLDSNGRALFHAILAAYAQNQFSPMSERLVSQLLKVIVSYRAGHNDAPVRRYFPKPVFLDEPLLADKVTPPMYSQVSSVY